MVEDRIQTIESRIRSSSNLPEAAKADLLNLLEELRVELHGVKKEHLETAERSASAVPARAESLEAAVGGLTGTVAELEAMHPKLAELANRLAVALGNMGI